MKIDLVREDVDTAMKLARIRQTIDTRDAFYDVEVLILRRTPPLSGADRRILPCPHDLPFPHRVENRFGKHLFPLAEAAQKTFKPEIMEDLSEENRLCTEYMKLLASAEIDFDGKKLNLSGLGPYQESSGPGNPPSGQSEAYFGFLGQNREKLDSIYDSLVHVRNRTALSWVSRNFVPLAYLRMSRLDYDANMVRDYRESILKTIVPVADSLRENQRIRLNLEHLYYYDLPFRFKSGNPKPQGSAQEIIREGAANVPRPFQGNRGIHRPDAGRGSYGPRKPSRQGRRRLLFLDTEIQSPIHLLQFQRHIRRCGRSDARSGACVSGAHEQGFRNPRNTSGRPWRPPRFIR